jgi:uncharacterized protein (DUF2345 family)
MAAPSLAAPPLSGTTRVISVPAGLFSTEDLRQLHRRLAQKAHDAATIQVSTLQQQPNQTLQQFQDLQDPVGTGNVPEG